MFRTSYIPGENIFQFIGFIHKCEINDTVCTTVRACGSVVG
jgi:hypothetical protein